LTPNQRRQADLPAEEAADESSTTVRAVEASSQAPAVVLDRVHTEDSHRVARVPTGTDSSSRRATTRGATLKRTTTRTTTRVEVGAVVGMSMMLVEAMVVLVTSIVTSTMTSMPNRGMAGARLLDDTMRAIDRLHRYTFTLIENVLVSYNPLLSQALVFLRFSLV